MKTELLVPRLNANDDTVELVKWLVDERARVVKGQEVVEIATMKASVTVAAEADGILVRAAPERTEIAVGGVLATIYGSEAEIGAAASNAPSAAATSEGDDIHARRAAKAARAAGAQTGVAQGDVSRQAQSAPARESIRVRLPAAADKLRTEPLDRAKRAEIDALSIGESGNITSSLTVQFHSERIHANLATQGVFGAKNFLPLILTEFAKVLASRPAFTAFCHDGSVYYYDRVDLGVAIDLGQGLRVVVVRDAAKCSPMQVYEAYMDFAARYMEGALGLADLTGATATVTDLSGEGILQFEPLINGHQSVILGIGGDARLPGHPISLTLAFDHRVLTGREVARALNELRNALVAYETKLPPLE